MLENQIKVSYNILDPWLLLNTRFSGDLGLTFLLICSEGRSVQMGEHVTSICHGPHHSPIDPRHEL